MNERKTISSGTFPDRIVLNETTHGRRVHYGFVLEDDLSAVELSLHLD